MAETRYGGYQGIYQWVIDKLPGFDLAGNAPHLGLTDNGDGSVTVNFFNRDYLVDAAGVRPLDGWPAGVVHCSLVAHYAMSAGRGEPSQDFVPLEALSGTLPGSGSSYRREAVIGPLLRRFADDSAGLETAVAGLGGRSEGRDPSGGLSWIFYPFPKVPLRLIYHEADDEFEAEFRILHERRSINFMEFEALAFMSGLLVDELCRED